MRSFRVEGLSLLVLVSLSFFAPFSIADDYIKIMKVKGRKAIVKLPSGNFEKGDEVKIDPGLFSGGSKMNGRRKYRADFDVSMGQTTVETIPDGGDSSEVTTLGLESEVTFGFNEKTYEYGPVITLEYGSAEAETSKTTSTSLGVGGFFDYNFASNEKGIDLVPYVGARLVYNSNSSTVEPESGDSTETTSSGILIGVEGGVKYFPANDHFAINAGLRYRNVGLTDQDSDQTNTTRIQAFAGMAAYF